MFTLWYNVVLFSVPLDNIMKIEIYFLSWAYIIIIGDFFSFCIICQIKPHICKENREFLT